MIVTMEIVLGAPEQDPLTTFVKSWYVTVPVGLNPPVRLAESLAVPPTVMVEVDGVVVIVGLAIVTMIVNVVELEVEWLASPP
jgi:hypothetical protein